MADNWRETQALVDALSASDNSLVDSLIRRIHPDSRFANAARSAAEVSKAIEDTPSLAVDWLIGPPDGDSAYDPIAEILRPREPKERPDKRPRSSAPTIDQVLAAADRLRETPAFVAEGDKTKGFRFGSEDVNTDDYPNVQKRGFSRSEKPIAELAREREAAMQRLIEEPLLDQAAVREAAVKDQMASLEQKKAAILGDAAAMEEERAQRALVEQAQAALMQYSGDADYSTQQLDRVGLIVDREIAEGKIPPANRKLRIKELLFQLLKDPRISRNAR